MNSVAVQRMYIDSRLGQLHIQLACPDSPVTHRPLLCFHLTPFSSAIYKRFLGEMGRDRLSIAVDTPGYGNSDAPTAPPSIADYAGAMCDLIDQLELDQIDLMGFHTGSKICLEVARQRPDRVHRIVMVSIAFWTAEERASRNIEISAPEITEDGSHLRQFWQELSRWSMADRSPQMIAETFYASQLRPAISHWGYQAAQPYDVETAMSEVESDKPILVLNPEDDLCEQAPRLKPLLRHPQSKFVDLPGWAHGFLDLRTEETATLIRSFLDN